MMVISLRWGNIITVVFCLVTLGAIVWLIAGASYGISGTIASYPSPVVQQWVSHLKHVILFSSLLLAFVGSSVWAATRDGNICIAALILCLYGLALAISVIYCQLTAKLLSKASNISIQGIKNKTIEQFLKQGEYCYEKDWVPKWLDLVQERSEHCCGIVSFEDWKEFRPQCPEEFPESCCKTSGDCVTNAGGVNWPETLGDHIKKDEGCGRVMVEQINDKIRESVKWMLVVSISITITLLTFLVKYTREYIIDKRKGDPEVPEDNQDNTESKRGGISVSCLAGVWCRMRRRMTNTKPFGLPVEGGDAAGGSVGSGPGQPNDAGDQHLDMGHKFRYESEQSVQPKASISDGGIGGEQVAEVVVVDHSKRNRPAVREDRATVSPQRQPQKSIASRFDDLRDAPSRLFNTEEVGGQDASGSRSVSTHSLISEDDINFVNKIQIEHPVQGIRNTKGLFPEDRERPTLKQLLKFGRMARKRKKSQPDDHDHDRHSEYGEGE